MSQASRAGFQGDGAPTSRTPDRLNGERDARLRPDNPKLILMKGMRVHLPEGLRPNGLLPWTAWRRFYETIATAINIMLGGTVAEKLTYLLPLDMAQRHVPSLHLCKVH
jgi:hypothetical protein